MAELTGSENLIREIVVDRDSEPSTILKQLGRNFYTLCRDRHFHVDSYYERDKSPTAEVSNGKQLGVSLSSLGLRNRNRNPENGRGLVRRC